MLDTAVEQQGESAGPRAYVPPKITPIADDAGFFKSIRVGLGNPYASVPASAYRLPYAAAKQGGRVTAHIADPEILEEILIRRVKDFPKTEIDSRVFRPSLGLGLLTAEGEDWRWKRRLAAPTFSPASLARMAPAMLAPFEAVAARWSAETVDRDVDAAMVDATLKVIERILFADPSELDLEKIAAATDAYLAPMGWVVIGAILRWPEWLPYPGRGRQMRARDVMRDSVREAVRRRREAAERGATPPKDLTAELLAARDPETDRPLSDEDMVDMLLTLVGAGHETSAHTLSWTLYCLAHQPELQDALAADAREAADGGPLGAEHMGALARIEAAVKETLRLFPVAPMMGRKTVKHERFGALDLPPGSLCAVPIYALHRHALYWERPDEFDIGRFLNQPDPPRTLYMPFGAGPRICIGARLAMMEMVLGLAAMLRQLRFAPSPKTECDPLHRVTLRPRGGLVLSVAPRP